MHRSYICIDQSSLSFFFRGRIKFRSDYCVIPDKLKTEEEEEGGSGGEEETEEQGEASSQIDVVMRSIYYN